MQTREATLCHGCDRELGADRYCASCEEVMPTYSFDVARAEAFGRKDELIRTVLASRLAGSDGDYIPVYRTVPSRCEAKFTQEAPKHRRAA